MNHEQRRELVGVLREGISSGIRNGVGLIAMWAWLVFFAYVAFMALSNDLDDTDGWKRSNMRLHTDAKTGCQYLSIPSGGITARLGADGQQMGCRR